MTATGAVITLVQGSTFCVSGRSADLSPEGAQGLFFRDTRILSTWRLQVDGQAPQVLSVTGEDSYRALFVSHVAPIGSGGSRLLVERRRYVGNGMREDLRIRNLGGRTERAQLTVEAGADFADLFQVREGRVPEPTRRPAPAQVAAASLTLWAGAAGRGRGVRVQADGARATPDRLHFQIEVPPHGDWRTTVLVLALVDGREVAASFPVDRDVEQSEPALRSRAWRSARPRVETADAGLQRTLRRSVDDLGALRIVDADHPDSVAVAAGAPWYMALFGRDSLLTSYLAMPLDRGLALGTLQALARTQGVEEDRRTEEQPGRILHETRLGADFPLSGGGSVYYGTADATPLFVTLLGELHRWGAPAEAMTALLPHADRALEWIERSGDRDGDGFVEYARMTDSGLLNQGWKDSSDGVNFADGTLAEPPIALCEVQAYVYAAYLARAQLAQDASPAEADRWSAKAAAFKRAFNETFWLPEREWFAVGLDRDKRPIDALASTMGHCLWTGLVDQDKATAVADRLLSAEMFTGWGVRTLASSMGAYNPMSYHNGSVWPHDNALIAAGLARYGFVEHAQRVATAILDAADAFEGRLPELFCGFDRSDYATPLPYPTSCSPQAWAAATPIHLLRTLLGLDPDVPRRRVSFVPSLPDRYCPLTVHDVRLGPDSVTLTVGEDQVSLVGVGEDVRVTSVRTAAELPA